MKKIKVKDIYLMNENLSGTIDQQERKRVVVLELIDDGIAHFFGSRIHGEIEEKINKSIPKNMVKLPFGITIFY